MRGRRRRTHGNDPGNHPDRRRAIHAAGVRGRDPGRAGPGQRNGGGRPGLWPGRGFRAVHPWLGFRVRQRDRFRSHGAGPGHAAAGSDGPAAVIATADSQRRWRRLFLIVGAIVAAYALLAPLTSLDAAQSANVPLLADKFWFRIATYVVMFVVMATAWNIIGGITGYAAFGNVAFFGIGAYTTGMLIAKAKWPFLVALPLAPILAALFAALVGLPLLRLRGHYFAVASLGVGVAVGELVQNIDYNGQPVFGGASGLFLPVYAVGHRGLFFFYLMCGAAAVAIAVTWWVLRSRFGYGLIAIRENEEAAAVLGVNTTAYKVGAFALAAALTGRAGGTFAQWSSFIDQESVFPIQYNVQMILMAIIGGAGTLFGPVAGAIVLEWLILSLAGGGASAVYAQMGLGVLLAVTVIFVPRGVVDFFGGSSKLSLGYFRRSLRETSV